MNLRYESRVALGNFLSMTLVLGGPESVRVVLNSSFKMIMRVVLNSQQPA